MLIDEVKQSFFDYLKRLDDIDRNILLQNIDTFLIDYNKENTLTQPTLTSDLINNISLLPEQPIIIKVSLRESDDIDLDLLDEPELEPDEPIQPDQLDQQNQIENHLDVITNNEKRGAENLAEILREHSLDDLIQIDESDTEIITPLESTVKSKSKGKSREKTRVSKTPKKPATEKSISKKTNAKTTEEELITPTKSKSSSPRKTVNSSGQKRNSPRVNKSVTSIKKSSSKSKTTSTVSRRRLPFKNRRPRSSTNKGFTLETINELVKEFTENDYPSTKKKEEIAARLNLNVNQITAWYRNRRNKLQRRKRVPTHLINYLVKEFNKNKTPSETEFANMAVKTKLPVSCITNWFESRFQKKEKKKRCVEHTDYLNKRYAENKYPSKETIRKIAAETNLTAKKVTIWFRSKRTRLKQTHLKGFTPEVQAYLIEKYNQSKYPDALSVLKMSLEKQISTFQINNWFKRRRFVLGHTKSNKFSQQIMTYLTEHFNQNNNPSKDDIVFMALESNLTTNQITQWFNDTRHALNRSTQTIQVTTSDSQVESIVLKKKRSSKYPKNVVDLLVKAYEENTYPEVDKIQELVASTNLATQQIYTWFNDRRKKLKQTRPNKHPPHVIDYLVSNYEQNMYPTGEEIDRMALYTRLTTQQINQWYMHRRHKHKRKKRSKNSLPPNIVCVSTTIQQLNSTI